MRSRCGAASTRASDQPLLPLTAQPHVLAAPHRLLIRPQLPLGAVELLTRAPFRADELARRLGQARVAVGLAVRAADGVPEHGAHWARVGLAGRRGRGRGRGREALSLGRAVELARRPCKPNPRPVCPMLWNPVCGPDGKTYSNPCLAKAACKLIGSKRGPCKKFNCYKRELWSDEKSMWCCKYMRLGCKG